MKCPKKHSRVRVLRDHGRWIAPGEIGIIIAIWHDDCAPEGTLYTVSLVPGRFQSLTRDCFEVMT